MTNDNGFWVMVPVRVWIGPDGKLGRIAHSDLNTAEDARTRGEYGTKEEAEGAIRDAVQATVREENEACAKLSETKYVSGAIDKYDVGRVIGAAIRARVTK